MHHHCDPGAWHFAGRRRFGAFANEGGPFGPGFGRGGHRGPFRGGKMLGDGELRLVVLALLADQPRHGYDIIKALEERSHGAYSPSPGVVYPTLTFLEEAGYTTATTEGAKKVYAITEAGRRALARAIAVLPAKDKYKSEFLFQMLLQQFISRDLMLAALDKQLADLKHDLARIAECQCAEQPHAGASFVAGYGNAVLTASVAYLEEKRAELLRDTTLQAAE